MSNDKDQNNISEDLDSALSAIKDFMQNVEPRLTEPDMFNTILKTAPLLYQKGKNKSTKLKIEKALDSLNDAKEDIKSSRLLFEGQIYSRSVFFLQQSVEKACKALGLALGFIKRQKSIGHESPEVFIKMLEDDFSINHYLPLLEQYTNENQKIKIEKAKESIFKGKSKLLILKEKEIQGYLTFIESMMNQGAEKLRAELNRIQESLNVFLPQFEIKVDLIVDFILCITSLYILSVITFPHTMTSRYSDTQIIHPKDYTIDMPIVEFLPKFQNITESAIESLDRYIRNIKLQ